MSRPRVPSGKPGYPSLHHSDPSRSLRDCSPQAAVSLGWAIFLDQFGWEHSNLNAWIQPILSRMHRHINFLYGRWKRNRYSIPSSKWQYLNHAADQYFSPRFQWNPSKVACVGHIVPPILRECHSIRCIYSRVTFVNAWNHKPSEYMDHNPFGKTTQFFISIVIILYSE